MIKVIANTQSHIFLNKTLTLQEFKMDLRDYRDIIAKTAKFPQEVSNFGLAYLMLGLIGEVDEYEEKLRDYTLDDGSKESRLALVKEAGDVVWYVTAMCQEADFDLFKVFDVRLNIDELFTKALRLPQLSERIKKHYRDGKPLIPSEFEYSLAFLLARVREELNAFDIELSEVLEVNYNKLMKRRETNTISGDGDNREEN